MPDALQAAEHRFWPKVDVGDCWQWTGASSKGYGYFVVESRQGDKPQWGMKAHRFAWLLLVGSIPDGFTIDHLCHNRGCVNPDHLEPVPHGVNVSRGATGRYKRSGFCKRGHVLERGVRNCPECQRQRNREYERRYAEANVRWR